MRVATDHFVRRGFFGSRVDEIAAETATTKRMIYYCFGSKDGLFAACLENVYAGIRAFETEMRLADLAPCDAITRYVSETLRYHEAHPELAFLVRTENVLGGVHIAPETLRHLQSRSIVDLLDEVLERGRTDGVFRSDVTGVDLHFVVSALANYRITNRTTMGILFGVFLGDPVRFEHDVDQYVSLVLAWLTSPEAADPSTVAGTFLPQPAPSPAAEPLKDQKGN